MDTQQQIPLAPEDSSPKTRRLQGLAAQDRLVSFILFGKERKIAPCISGSPAVLPALLSLLPPAGSTHSSAAPHQLGGMNVKAMRNHSLLADPGLSFGRAVSASHRSEPKRSVMQASLPHSGCALGSSACRPLTNPLLAPPKVKLQSLPVVCWGSAVSARPLLEQSRGTEPCRQLSPTDLHLRCGAGDDQRQLPHLLHKLLPAEWYRYCLTNQAIWLPNKTT